MGESKGANEVDRAAQAAKEVAESAAEQAKETIEDAQEAVEDASETATEAAGDEASESSDQHDAVAEVDKESVELTSKDGKHTISVELPRGREKTIQFTISGTCKSGDCGSASCTKTFLIKIERPKD
jgi:hypothetical protein